MVTFIRVLHGQDIYKSIEEKGANFLYLIVKNHVFADGNKRIAATLFIYLLNFYGILYKNGKQVIDNFWIMNKIGGKQYVKLWVYSRKCNN